MKFSEIKKEEWPALKPYLDTCLLPVTGLSAGVSPVEAVDELERLRDVLDLLERPYRGRTVTYPAWHFVIDNAKTREQLRELVQELKSASGFRFVILVTLVEEFREDQALPEADLIITPANADEIPRLIESLWK